MVRLRKPRAEPRRCSRLPLIASVGQYRVRKAEEGLGRPIDDERLHVELALLASQWLGAAVLRRARRSGADRTPGPT